MKIQIGDLFWDEHRCWCDGSQELNVCYLVLSADVAKAGGEDFYCYRCAFFMWAGRSSGYCGAHIRDFFERQDLLKMTRVGNLSDIKSFKGD